MELKKIGVWSFTKISTIVGFIAGILSVIFIAILIKLQSNITADQLAASGIPRLELTPSVALITLVYYTAIGFIAGIVISLLYNLIAKWVGGIKLEFVDHKK